MATPNPAGITPEILLDHMRGMEHRLQSEIGNLRIETKRGFERVDANMDNMLRRMDWFDVAKGNFNERLDDIEEIHLPKLRKAVRTLSKR